MRIGLSFHGGDPDYEYYPSALHRRADAIGISLETEWLAGKGRPQRFDLIDSLDAVVLTGGPDVGPERYGLTDTAGTCRTDPERDAIEWVLLEELTANPKPTLAICRGAQLLNVFHGGSLIPDLHERNAVHRRDDSFRRRAHDVALRPGTLLSAITGAVHGAVNSSHHQAVDRLARGFRVSASSEDGVVEAFEPIDTEGHPFLLAVQWHPEAMEDGLPLSDYVLDALLRALPRY
jgi:putative glutamine amidotransferase